MTAQEFFKNDLFAENAGVVLLEVRKGTVSQIRINPNILTQVPAHKEERSSH